MLILGLISAFALAPSSAPAGKKSTKIMVDNNFFSPERKTIGKGTKVKFKWTGGGAPHNVIKKRARAASSPLI